MKAKKLLCFVFSICLTFFAFAGGAKPANAAAFDLNVSISYVEGMSGGLIEGLNRIQERSNGRIKMTYYFMWSLSSVRTIVDDLDAGTVDIGMVPITEYTSQFPYTAAVTYMPLIGFPHMLETGKLYDEMYKAYPEFAKEFEKNGIVYLTNFANSPYHVWTTGKRIRTPRDLAGARLVTSSSMLQELFSANGGAPVTMPITDYAVSMSSGVVDGAVMHINTMRGAGALDFVKAATVFADEGLVASCMVTAISGQTWKKLPEDLKQLFREEADRIRDGQARSLYDASLANMQLLKDRGADIISLSKDELDDWRKAVAPLIDKYLDSLERDGHKRAREFFKVMQGKIAAR